MADNPDVAPDHEQEQDAPPEQDTPTPPARTPDEDRADYQAFLSWKAQHQPPAPPEPPKELHPGDLVAHRWVDPTGPRVRHGRVHSVVTPRDDQGNAGDPHARVEWLDVSTPIPFADLEAVDEL